MTIDKRLNGLIKSSSTSTKEMIIGMLEAQNGIKEYIKGNLTKTLPLMPNSLGYIIGVHFIFENISVNEMEHLVTGAIEDDKELFIHHLKVKNRNLSEIIAAI